MLFLSGCEPSQNELTSSLNHKSRFFIFGTEVDLQLRGIEQELAQQLFAAINQDLMEFHRNWHPWLPGEIESLNQAIARNESAAVSDKTLMMLQLAQAYANSSQDYFNPAIGGLVRLWGFHTDHYPVTSPPPKQTEIDKWIAAKPVMADLDLNDSTISSSNQKLRIDVSGFAKGYAVDHVIDRLKASNVPSALVNAGGDLRAYGDPMQPWRIAIRHPVTGDVLAGLSVVADEAIFTSGNYARYKQFESQRYSHILDPVTGYPVDRISSATVIAGSGGEADAAATALVVSGPERMRQLMDSMNLDHVLLVDEQGCVYLDHSFEIRLEWVQKEPECMVRY